MKSLFIPKTANTPEINFSPAENLFLIKGTSAPEDVRAMYYPVAEWIKILVDDILEGEYKVYSPENPLRMQTDLEYYNSSSAKFIYDIFAELKRLNDSGIPVIVDWIYDEEDLDQMEAGEDIALLVEMKFNFISKKRIT
jgi:hypothetical protein